MSLARRFQGLTQFCRLLFTVTDVTNSGDAPVTTRHRTPSASRTSLLSLRRGFPSFALRQRANVVTVCAPFNSRGSVIRQLVSVDFSDSAESVTPLWLN